MIYSEEEIMGLMNETQQVSPLKAVEEGKSGDSYTTSSWYFCASVGPYGEDWWC